MITKNGHLHVHETIDIPSICTMTWQRVRFPGHVRWGMNTSVGHYLIKNL